MKKTTILFYIAAICVVLMCSGCTPEKAKKPITITLWHYYSAGIKTQFDALIQEFNETEGRKKGVIIDAYSQGGVNELADAVLAAANKDIGAKPMPKIFAAYSDSVYRLDSLGVIADLDAYFTEKELAVYRKEFIEDGRIGETKKLKIIPVAKSTELLFINATAFNEFAKETGTGYEDLATWEGLVKIAGQYYNWSGGKSLFGIDSMANFMIIATKQLGGDILAVSGEKIKFNLSVQNAKKIWDTFYIPFINEYFSATGRFRSDDVKTGSIVMFTGSNSSASFFPHVIETGRNTSSTVESAVLPYPSFTGKQKYSIHQGAGMVVAKNDKKTEQVCADFLKWLTAPEQNLHFAVSTAYLPVTNKALSYQTIVQMLGTEDPKNILLQTAKAVCDMFSSYQLYASPPFDKSFEARNILNNSLTSRAQSDLKKIKEQTAAGKSRTALIKTYASESSFMQWYEQLESEINKLLN